MDALKVSEINVAVDQNFETVQIAMGDHGLSDAEKTELLSRLRVIYSNCDVKLHENCLEIALHQGVDRASVELALGDQIIRIKFNREHAELRKLLYSQLMQ